MSAPHRPPSQSSGGIMGRAVLAVVLILALIATSWTRDKAIEGHETLRNRGRIPGVAATSDSSLASMPSFATALLLGGLRGPLVMILWTSSETQKQQHNLEDFDTKVEWIRLLQPEFDPVHLFQIWNKAYNISVQVASLRNKYTTILDAIDYGQKVEKERPDDINIIANVGGVFGTKLGTSAEHVYYRSRIRRESQTLTRLTFPKAREGEFRALAAKLGMIEDESPIILDEKTQNDQVVVEPVMARQLQAEFTGPGVTYSPDTRRDSLRHDPTWRRVRLDPMLDENGNILPALLEPRYPRPANLPASDPWYDGSQLQFLKQYEPFPYGISTLALAYNDYKRSQYLQNLWHERHIQTGDTVIDSQPGLTLKEWAKDEWERGRRFEMRMWGISIPQDVDQVELELPTANDAFDKPTPDRASLDAAIYSYGLGARLFGDAKVEIQQHIVNYKSFASVFFVHVDDCISGEAMMQADHDYLAAAVATGPERERLIGLAVKEYQFAKLRCAVTVLKFYMNDQAAANSYPIDPHTGQRYNRATIESSDPNTYLTTLIAAMVANNTQFADPDTHKYSPQRDGSYDDRNLYLTYMSRCDERLKLLQPITATRP